MNVLNLQGKKWAMEIRTCEKLKSLIGQVDYLIRLWSTP